MITPINFICPECKEHAQIVEHVRLAAIKREITSIAVEPKAKGGNSYLPEFGEPTVRGGQIETFSCSWCGYKIKTDPSQPWVRVENAKSYCQLFRWLKKRGMLPKELEVMT